MKVEVTQRFRDIEADLETREAGAILEVRKERADHLISIGFAKAIRQNPKEKDAAG